MAQETKTNTKETEQSKQAQEKTAKSVYGEKKKESQDKKNFKKEKKEEFEQEVLDIARVTRVMSGGRRMSFRACVGVGDKTNRIGIGLGKGTDVSVAVNKAANEAKKNMITVPMVNETIPHEVFEKKGASKLLFKPAIKGSGIIAGGVVRIILKLAGVNNVTSKILGTSNKMNNAFCTLQALNRLKKVDTNQDTKQENTKENNKTESTQEKKK
jgi:Ribosomal protein S5